MSPTRSIVNIANHLCSPLGLGLLSLMLMQACAHSASAQVCVASHCAACDAGACGQHVVTGVDSAACLNCGEANWTMRGPLPWDLFAHGEYIGPHRTPHVPVYRLRVDDELDCVYRLTRERSSCPYRLNVGDRVRVESLADENLDRELEVQPDGTITLRLVGEVMAAGQTTDELRIEVEKSYKRFYRVPSITVTPIKVNTKLEDIRATVDARQGLGGQSRRARVTPDGSIQLPAIGSIPALGLTLDELKLEIDARYAEIVDGLEITPVLQLRAPRFIYVLGEVVEPGRFELVGPTTVTQAISLAKGWKVGANLNQIVIFRRAEDWRLLATKVDVRGALFGRRPAPSDEILAAGLRRGDRAQDAAQIHHGRDRPDLYPGRLSRCSLPHQWLLLQQRDDPGPLGQCRPLSSLISRHALRPATRSNMVFASMENRTLKRFG